MNTMTAIQGSSAALMKMQAATMSKSCGTMLNRTAPPQATVRCRQEASHERWYIVAARTVPPAQEQGGIAPDPSSQSRLPLKGS